VSDPDSTFCPATEFKSATPDRRFYFSRTLLKLSFVFGILLVLSCFLVGPIPPGNIGGQTSYWMQAAYRIGKMMVAYANDNNGNYPDGKSSTKVFQKLLDGKYCTDPTIFYIPLAGKIEPLRGQKLKPENVCFDVTSGVDATASEVLPVVFMTGYKLTYAPGGSAMPLIKPYPQFGPPRTWTQWRYGWGISGIAVTYKNTNARFIHLNTDRYGLVIGSLANPDGSIPEVVPADFDPKGKTYRQLTPDGMLSQ
jgi:hypothetical protein